MLLGRVREVHHATNRRLLILAVAYVVLNVVDIVLTLYMVKDNGGTELNPFMAYMLKQPLWTCIGWKVFGSALAASAILILPKRLLQFKYDVMILLVALMVGIVAFNMTHVWRFYL